MAIEKGTYIKLAYTGTVGGKVFDTTDEEAAKKANIFRENAIYGPAVVKVGSGHVLKGVDEDLEGKEIGKEYTVSLKPEKAFGEHDKNLIKAYDKKDLPNKPELFSNVTVEGREGIVVNKVGSRYLVDFNHPLAGQELEYTYTIEGIVEDGTEKLSGLIKLLTGRELKVSNAHKDFISIEVPVMMAMYDKNWFMTQYMISQEAFEIFPEIKDVRYCEKFPRPEVKKEEEKAEEKSEAEKE